MGSLERWYRAVEDLPSKYPGVDIAAQFPVIVDLYLRRLSVDETVELFHRVPASLVRDVIGIVREAFLEAHGGDDDGPSFGGMGARRPVTPPSLTAAESKPLPKEGDL